MTNLATFPLQFELLSFLNWQDRRSLLLVNRRWASLYYQQDVYRFFLARLNIECGVYSCIKVATPPTGYTWKSLFYESYSQRYIHLIFYLLALSLTHSLKVNMARKED